MEAGACLQPLQIAYYLAESVSLHRYKGPKASLSRQDYHIEELPSTTCRLENIQTRTNMHFSTTTILAAAIGYAIANPLQLTLSITDNRDVRTSPDHRGAITPAWEKENK